MNINNVSFGKVVKVHAHIVPAMEIASIANERTKSADSLKMKVKSLFPDNKDGSVRIHVADNRTSYLFSGKESTEFDKIQREKREKVIKAVNYFHGSQYSDYYSDLAVSEYEDKVSDLINKSKGITEISAETYPDSSEIKSINVIA